MTDIETFADMLRNSNVVGIPSSQVIATMTWGMADVNVSDGESCLKFMFLDGKSQGIERKV